MVFLILLFCVFFSSCTKVPPNEIAVNQQINSFAKQMERGKKLSLVATGGSSLNQRKRVFYLNFWTEKKLNVDEARILFIQTAEDFLKQVNQNETLRPFLENYPVTIQNLELSIGFFATHLEHLSAQYVSEILSYKGKIFYSSWSPEKNFYERIKIETWEEALQSAEASSTEK